VPPVSCALDISNNSVDINSENYFDIRFKSQLRGVNPGLWICPFYCHKAAFFGGWKARYLSEILLYIDDQHLFDSEDWIKKAIKADKKNGMMLHLGKNYALYAQSNRNFQRMRSRWVGG
jgi:hypothetical protein